MTIVHCEYCGSDIEKGKHWYPIYHREEGLKVLCASCQEMQGRTLLRILNEHHQDCHVTKE